MDRETVRRRIAALLRLGQSPNQHEAFVAVTKARELAARYGLDLAEAGSQPEPDANQVVELDLELAGVAGEKWALTVASVVARHFRCEVFWSYDMQAWLNRGEKRRTLIAVGLRDDLELALPVVYFAIGSVLQLGDAYVATRPARERPKARRQYGIGFAAGLKAALDEQDRAHAGDAGWALALRVPAVVADRLKGMGTTSAPRLTDADAFLKGRADGYDRGRAPRKGVADHE